MAEEESPSLVTVTPSGNPQEGRTWTYNLGATSLQCRIWVYWGLTGVNWCLLKGAPPISAPCGHTRLSAACCFPVLPSGNLLREEVLWGRRQSVRGKGWGGVGWDENRGAAGG